MTTPPTLWNRFCAKMVGEVSADTLEAYRRASLAVYDTLAHAETHRESAKPDGKNAWTLSDNTKAEILCSWNAPCASEPELRDADSANTRAAKFCADL